MEEKNNKINIYYVVILVLVLMISAVTVSYAFINIVSGTENSANTTVSGKTECIKIDLVEDNSSTYSLDYNYPITDNFATSHVTPIKVKITNTCDAGQSDIDYTVVLTTLADTQATANYIPASKIKIKVDKQIDSDDKSTIIATSMLNNVKTLPTDSSSTKNILENQLSQEKEKEPAKFTEDSYEHYVLDVGTIASKKSITFETYLWIDYNEGGGDGANASTQGKNFKTIVSVIVNNPEEGVTGGLKTA